jgi:hypothetical protein
LILFRQIFPSGARLRSRDDPGDIRIFSIHTVRVFLCALALGAFFSFGLSPFLPLALSLSLDN